MKLPFIDTNRRVQKRDRISSPSLTQMHRYSACCWPLKLVDLVRVPLFDLTCEGINLTGADRAIIGTNLKQFLVVNMKDDIDILVACLSLPILAAKDKPQEYQYHLSFTYHSQLILHGTRLTIRYYYFFADTIRLWIGSTDSDKRKMSSYTDWSQRPLSKKKFTGSKYSKDHWSSPWWINEIITGAQLQSYPLILFRYFTQQELCELFKFDGDINLSITQQQLELLHSGRRVTDTLLDKHIAFLRSLKISGVSDHDLLYTESTEQVPVAEEVRDQVRNEVDQLSLWRHEKPSRNCNNPRPRTPRRKEDSTSWKRLQWENER